MFRKLAVVSFLLAALPVLAVDEVNVVPGLTAKGAPLGLHGFDPVAYIEIGNRSEGSAMHASVHDGVTFYFTSEANLKTFERAPERYTPQNGGFCTFGVSVGKKFNGNPNFHAVVDGKLYVFLNESIFRMFDKDRAGTIAKASKNWKRIRTISATAL